MEILWLFKTSSLHFFRRGLGPFDCSDSSGIAARWERGLRAFELFAEGKGITNHGKKKALLLHTEP